MKVGNREIEKEVNWQITKQNRLSVYINVFWKNELPSLLCSYHWKNNKIDV